MIRERLRRGVDVRTWPLALRVVTVTTLLALLAILAVGVYLSTVIADGLYEQRRDRVLEETVDVRGALTDTLTQLPGATTTQQQDAAFAFVQDTGGQGDATRREVALVPADPSGTVLSVASDQDLLSLVDPDLEDEVAAHPDSLAWRSVGLPDGAHGTTPALLVGSRVTVAGAAQVQSFARAGTPSPLVSPRAVTVTSARLCPTGVTGTMAVMRVSSRTV